MGDRAVRWMPGILLTTLVVWVLARTTRPISDPDDWWHLRLGNDLISQTSFSAPPHWSVYATVPWVPTEPLPEIVSAFVERVAGLPGLVFLFAAALLTVLLTIYLTNRREGSPLPASVACVLAVLAASASLTSRPQLVSFVLLPVLLAAWLQTERDGRARWWLVPLVWLWSMCHGFWFIGAAYGGLFVVGFALSRRFDGRTLLRQAAVAAASTAVVALNPVGLGVLEAPFHVQSTSRFIVEWQRTSITMPAAIGGALMVLVTALVGVLTRQGGTLTRLLLLLSAVFWLWYAARTVAIGGLVAAPLLTGALEALVTRTPEDRGTTRGVTRREVGLLSAAALVALVVAGIRAPIAGQDPGHVPTGLDGALDSLPVGTRVFNAYELGGWLTWRHPDLEQYIDGLITPYSGAHVQNYADAIEQKPGWLRVVQDSGADVALLPSDSRLALGLEGRGWSAVRSDAGYALLRAPSGWSS